MDGIARRTCAAAVLALVVTLCAAAPALAHDGLVKGKKWHDANANGLWDSGEQPVKDWWIYLDVDRDGVRDSGEPADQTNSSGEYAISGIKWWVPHDQPRTYDVREKPVGEQPQPLDQCSYPVPCKHTLTFSNSKHHHYDKNFGNYKGGKIVVKKVNVGGTQTEAFDFTSAALGNFSLAASDTGGKSFSSLKPGTYGVAEQARAGYALTKSECDDGSPVSAIKLTSGETVTCTFTNTRTTGQIKVVKKLLPSSDPGTFDLSVNGAKVVSGGDGANATVTVPTGSGHSVAEAGATLAKYDSSVSCTDGSSGTTSASGITVTAGQTTVCTFTNTRKQGSIKVIKKLVPAADSGRFDLVVGGQVVADGAGDGGSGTRQVAPGAYVVSESGDGATDLAHYASSIECRKGAQVVAAGAGTSLGGVAVDSGEQVVCTITNTRKATVTVSKTEGGQATLGQVWSFALRGGPGNVNITRTTAGGSRIDFGQLLPGAYQLCEVGLPAGWHSSLGVAVGGEVCIGVTLAPGDAKTVAVDNIRPAIELLKQVRHGGAWAKETTLEVGMTAEYLLTVTNPGVGPLVDLVVIDDRCDAAPAYTGGDADADGKLDETEAWTYRCDHVVTAADGARFVNTATADATDERGNQVRDSDTAIVNVTEPPSIPPPSSRPPAPPASQPVDEQRVLPAEIVSGTARMRGPSGCTKRPFKARVSGRQIQRVTFWLDGKQVKRIVAKRGQTAFALKVDPRKVARGVHQVRARVVFAAASDTAPRTLRLSFQRCARRVVTPQFTG
jgi:Prealbumin-like fold domain